MTDLAPAARCVWLALDASVLLAARHREFPIVVHNQAEALSWPATRPRIGAPVVDMFVLSDGVQLVASLYQAPERIADADVPYPLYGGVPDPVAVASPAWTAALATHLSVMLAHLHTPRTLGLYLRP
jgi:hypothetical protein